MNPRLKKTLALALLLAAVALMAPRASHAFDFFGLFPPTVEGTVSSVAPNYLAVLDKSQKPFVFVFKPGFIQPQGLAAGRRVKVEYKKRQDGLLEVKKIELQ